MGVTRRHWLGMASALAVGGAASAATRRPLLPLSIEVRSRGTRDPSALLTALSGYAAAEVRAFGLPGLTMAVVGPDGLEAAITIGYSDLERGLPVRSDQLFQIGSISKSLVALCLYRLAGEGKVDLDGPVAAILSDVPLPDAKITVAMLLNHTAALPDDAPTFPRSPDGRLWTNYPTATHFSYSNTGFNLLGLIIAKVSGMPFHQALQSLVLEPLGMIHARPLILTRDRARFPIGYREYGVGPYFPDSQLAPGPWLDIELAAGSVAATPADMARYIAFLIRVGRGQGAPILTDALARRWSTRTTDAPAFGPKAGYAAGMATVEIDGRQLFHHTGGMILFHSSITVDPQAKAGVFASTNSGAGDYRPRGITHFGCRLLRAFAEGRPLPAAPKIVAVPPVEAAGDYAGRFVAANGDSLAITAAGSALAVAADGVTGRLFPAGKARFAVDHPRLARHEIAFVGHDRLWWGGTLYGRGSAAATPAVADRLRGFPGLYVNESPWAGAISVVARGDELVIEGMGRIERAADGSWRLAGVGPSAERVWFEAMLDGKAQRMVSSGSDFLRFHEQTD